MGKCARVLVYAATGRVDHFVHRADERIEDVCGQVRVREKRGYVIAELAQPSGHLFVRLALLQDPLALFFVVNDVRRSLLGAPGSFPFPGISRPSL